MIKVQNYNNDFLLLCGKDPEKLRRIGRGIYAKSFDFIEEVIVTELEICLKLNQRFREYKISQLMSLDLDEDDVGIIYQLPICFTDHDDWKLVEQYTGLTRSEVVQKILLSEYTIAMFGFLPGFLYLNGLDKKIQVPRKNIPAKYVKANSVAIGGKYLGVYALDSPGGWNVIGTIPFSMLQIPNLPPVIPNLGDRIRLVSIDRKELRQLIQRKITLMEYNG